MHEMSMKATIKSDATISILAHLKWITTEHVSKQCDKKEKYLSISPEIR